MFEQYTPGAKSVIGRAEQEARMLWHSDVGPEHLLLACLQLDNLLPAKVLRHLGLTYAAVREQVRTMMPASQSGQSGFVPFDRQSRTVLQNALREADQLRAEEVGSEHILLALFRTDDLMSVKVLEALGLGREEIRAMVNKFIGGYDPELEALARPLGETGHSVGQVLDALGTALGPLLTLLEVLKVPNLDHQAAKEHAPQMLALFDFLVTTGALAGLDDNLVEAMELYIQEFVEDN